uniref:COMM domain containing 2 n=1 Tax=Tetraodon nigroviridis TaxID=99883 RepID=H3CNW0_TETNG
MLLLLSEDHRDHLALLTEVEPPVLEHSVVAEFGRMALELLRRGTSTKTYEGAARKLAVPVDAVQRGVEGLLLLMTESSKHLISEVDFLDSVLSLDLGDEVSQVLLKLYQEHRGQIRSTLHQLPHRLPAYHNLEWRLDVQVGHRLDVQIGHRLDVQVGQLKAEKSCSPPLLFAALGGTLEAALETSKTSHARRILRSL